MKHENFSSPHPDDPGLEGKGIAHVWVNKAHIEDVLLVLGADSGDFDGRSPWTWVRFPNGDLMLATFPRGMTYEMVSERAST